MTATDPHISILGHSTPAELRRLLTEEHVANGLGNRFLIVYVQRTQRCPSGDRVPEEKMVPLANQLQEAVTFARTVGEMRRTKAAEKVWNRVYGPLTEDGTGMRGALTHRAAPHVIRLAMVYALADHRHEIDAPHLSAAVAFWQYVKDSVESIFGESLGDSVADDILAELKTIFPEGMTRTEIQKHFSGRVYGAKLNLALKLLEKHGLARRAREKTAGRSAEKWYAMAP